MLPPFADKRPEDDEQWPRIVRETLHRNNHTICRMCVANGKLTEEIFTKNKHGKYVLTEYNFVRDPREITRDLFVARDMYTCARKSQWGDRLPMRYKEQEDILEGQDAVSEETVIE